MSLHLWLLTGGLTQIHLFPGDRTNTPYLCVLFLQSTSQRRVIIRQNCILTWNFVFISQTVKWRIIYSLPSFCLDCNAIFYFFSWVKETLDWKEIEYQQQFGWLLPLGLVLVTRERERKRELTDHRFHFWSFMILLSHDTNDAMLLASSEEFQLMSKLSAVFSQHWDMRLSGT